MEIIKEDLESISILNRKYPEGGLISGKTWLKSPSPLNITDIVGKKNIKLLKNLGNYLAHFLRSSNSIYLRSLKGSLPPYIKDIIEAGKPDWLVKISRESAKKGSLPLVIRPDLLITENGFSLTEIDSVPGGIGLTSWLCETYGEKFNILGGKDSMTKSFINFFGKDAENQEKIMLISEESSGYKNEMQWLVNRVNEQKKDDSNYKPWKVKGADNFDFKNYGSEANKTNIYRFFELFDYENISYRDFTKNLNYKNNRISINSPINSSFEEKSWLGLFHLAPLKKVWERELRSSLFSTLQKIIPYTWIIDPSNINYNAVLPHLNVNNWEEVKEFSQKQRDLIIKISGFSEIGWGSKSVTVGNDVSGDEWSNKLDLAINSFKKNPYILQNFEKTLLVKQKYHDPEENKIKIMDGRVRLCPYYFFDGKNYNLSGTLATICHADKKIIHGMSNAILTTAM